MKLLIIISVIAYSYAEKLDNTYLPPENAATAGGSPGSLAAPGSQTGPGLSNTPSSFGQPSGATFGQPSGPTFGQGTSQNLPQSGSTQPGQSASGQYTPQQYGQSGLPQAGGPGFGQGSVGVNQAGISPLAGSPGIGQGSPGYNQAGALAGSNRPGFGQAPVGYNQGPAFGGQAQIPSAYAGQVQPERARASIDRNAEILRYDNQRDGDYYSYSFETSNGISAEESGVATNGVRAKGSFAYTGDDGQQYRVTYTADENGYLPQGDHLPTPPPIPEEILKSLEENARAAAAGTQEGAYNPNEDFGVGAIPQQAGGIYTGQIQPGQSGVGYRPGQGAISVGQQGFQNQGPTSQYGLTGPNAQAGLGSSSNAPFGASQTPGSSSVGYPGAQGSQPLSPQNGVAITSPGYQGSLAQGNQAPTSQYNVGGLSPSGIAPTSRPQGSIGFPSGSVTAGQQGVNPNLGYQYNAPGSSSAPGQYQPQGTQVSIGQNPTAQYNRPGVEGRPSGLTGNYRPGSQTPIGTTGSVSRPNQFTQSNGGPNTSPQAGSSSRPNLASQGNQNSGYNYNAPTGLSSTRPLGTGPLNRPQDQSQSAQNIPAAQGTQTLQQGGQSPSTQYSGPVSSPIGSVRPQGSQGYPSQENQASQTQSGLNQRPQLGNFGPSGSKTQRPSGQRQDDGYQYDRPQNQFSPSQTGSGITRPSGPGTTLNQFNRPSLGVTSSTPIQSTTAFTGNNYAPSGPLSAGPTTAPNVFGSSKPSVSNQGYPSGPANTGSTGSAPVVIGQGSNTPRPGQYPSSGSTSGPTGSTFTRPGISVGGYEPTSQYQSGQNTGGASPSVGSGYQYDRPSSQGPTPGTGSQSPFGSQPGSGSTSLGQNNSGRVDSQPGFAPTSQDRPGQTGPSGPGQSSSQPGYRPSGQERPTENFGGPRQPPSFSPEEGYKY